MTKLLNTFFNDQKGLRRLSKCVLLVLIIFATFRVFMNMSEVNQAIAICYSTLIGAAGASIWKYMETRTKEENKK